MANIVKFPGQATDPTLAGLEPEQLYQLSILLRDALLRLSSVEADLQAVRGRLLEAAAAEAPDAKPVDTKEVL